MAVDFQVVRFQKTATGGNGTTQDVSLNFTPKAIIVVSEGKTSDNSATSDYSYSYGFSDGTNHACVSGFMIDNQATNRSARIHRNNAVYSRLLATSGIQNPTEQARASVSFQTNAVRFTYDLQDSTASYITVIAFAGSDITNAKVATTTIGTTSTGTQNYTGLGFTPSDGLAALFTLAGDVTTANTVTDGLSLSHGFGTSSSKRGTIANVHEYNSGLGNSDTWTYYNDARCLSNLVVTTGAIDFIADFSAWVSDGFQLDIEDGAASSSTLFSYLVINGGTWDAGSDTTQSGTTKNHSVSVSSKTLRGLGTLYPSYTGHSMSASVQSHGAIASGFSDGSQEAFMAASTEDNQSTGDTSSINAASNLVIGISSSIPYASTTITGDFSSFGTNQFSITYNSHTAETFSWWVVADGGESTTPVTATRTHKYNIIGLLTATRTHKYNILQTITATRTHKYDVTNVIAADALRTHKYNILEAVTTTRTHKYNIIGLLTALRTHKYNILELITALRTHKYNILESVTKTTTHKYNILESITATKTHKYNILESITATRTHKYDIEAGTIEVTATRTHKYDIIASITATRTHKYHVEGLITALRTHKYNILERVTATKTHKFNILELVQTLKTHKYNIIGLITALRTHKYHVEGLVTAVKTHKFNILESVTTTKTHKYNILELVQALKTHKYNIIEAIQALRTHKYDIEGTIEAVTATRTHKYNILESVTSTKTHKYDILEAITTTKTHKYNILETLTATKTHKYNILESLLATRTHKYNLLQLVSSLKTHKYHIEGLVTALRTHKFNILESLTATRTHKFNLLQGVQTLKTHKYNILKLVSTLKTHKYNIIGLLTTTRTHKYDILDQSLTATKTHKYNILERVTPAKTLTAKYDVIQSITTFIGDRRYTAPLGIRLRFASLGNPTKFNYDYDSFDPDSRPFDILACSVRLAQGEVGSFTIDIEDSAEIVNKAQIGFGNKITVEVKKEYHQEWLPVCTGFVRRIRKIRSATNVLIWRVTGYSTQIVFNERVVNFRRAAKREQVDSPIPLLTDERMLAYRLAIDLITSTDIIPLRKPTIQNTGGYQSLAGISDRVDDFIAQIGPGLTDATTVMNALAELTGAIWGTDETGEPYFRYPHAVHSGIIITDDPQDTDPASITSTNLDAFEYEDSIDQSEGFANRLYVLNAVDTKSTASSSSGLGSTTLTIRGVAQQFTSTDNNVTGAAFILSKVGTPVPYDNSNVITGYLRADFNNFPTGATLATFEIPIDQITNAQETIFVNDIKTETGTINPGQKYWWVLIGRFNDDSNTVRWHHNNIQNNTSQPFSARLPLVDADPTQPGQQLNWQRNPAGPVYAFSTFSSVRHVITQSDADSIARYGLIEGIVDLPAFEDDDTFSKALVKILDTSAKPKRVYDYARVTIPTNKIFVPGQLVTVIDSKAKLTSEKNVTAEISEVTYTFDTKQNALGVKYVDIRLIGFIDETLDDYLDTTPCI